MDILRTISSEALAGLRLIVCAAGAAGAVAVAMIVTGRYEWFQAAFVAAAGAATTVALVRERTGLPSMVSWRDIALITVAVLANASSLLSWGFYLWMIAAAATAYLIHIVARAMIVVNQNTSTAPDNLPELQLDDR